MINDRHLDRIVTQQLVLKNEVERKNHTPSGKLSASILGNPLQWQILKIIGVPERPLDPYVLRKFLRGKDVEEWVIKVMDTDGCLRGQQMPIEYRGAVGYVDALLDMTQWESELGLVPHEVKSVTNAKFKNILKNKNADPQHRLQATMYALALQADYYAIDYIASDDYRIYTMVYPTNSTSDAVERVIDSFIEQKKSGKVPVFEAKLSWQASPNYNNYPEWMDITKQQIEEKLQTEYPEAFQRLKGGEC